MRLRTVLAGAFALAAICSLAVVLAGCQASPRAQLDRAEVLYGETVDATNQLRRQGAIDARTFVEVVTPARLAARAAIDQARAALLLGETDRVRLLLDSATAALGKLQQYRSQAATRPAPTRPASRPSISALPPPAAAGVDPVTAGLELLMLISRLAPVAAKLIGGQELTDEERALAEQHSRDATAQADTLDAEARQQL